MLWDKTADVDLGKQLDLIKSLVSGGSMHYSGKVRSFISDGFYAEEDLRQCVLSATSIRKVEKDEKGEAYVRLEVHYSRAGYFWTPLLHMREGGRIHRWTQGVLLHHCP